MKRDYVHQAFHRMAESFPNGVAIEWGDERITYSQLESRSNNLANFMLASGCPKGSIVAILAESAVEIVTAIIATLKAGCVFVPLDPRIPDKRLQALIAEVSPRWALAESRFLGRLASLLGSSPSPARIVRLDNEEASDGGDSPVTHLTEYSGYWNPLSPAVASDPDDMCYVYFTSGSTGRPKGIAGRLKAISHFIEWEKKTLGLSEGVRVSQLTSPSFDAYLRDIFVPLCAGGTVCAPKGRESLLDPRKLIDWVDAKGINLVHCVPSLFRSMLNEDLNPGGFPSLRFILLAGEPLLPSDIKRWTNVYKQRVQLVNLYGPSETTMTKFFYFVKPSDQDRRSIPIGKPMEGAKAIIIDGKGNVASTGAIGEIYIRTPFRTLGYYNQPELTKEAFIQNPFNGDASDIVYKTGDLGRVLEDGNFEFLGRQDHQVKIRGVRIETAEIEDLLRSHEAITDVAVVDREDTNQSKYLCAYVVLNQEVAAPSLREHLAEHLAEYALPSAFVVLDHLPRTISGKVDRKALPAPSEACASKAYTPARTPLEEGLAAIWSQLLSVERVGADDNFFELGGHSLLATQLLSRVRASFGVELPFRSFFSAPTLEGLALAVTQALVEQRDEEEIARIIDEMDQMLGGAVEGKPDESERMSRKQESRFPFDVTQLSPQRRRVLESVLKRRRSAAQLPSITCQSRDYNAFPLSFAQQRLWFIHQMEPGSAAYNMPMAVRLQGRLSITALRQSLQEIARRHEVLRTRFEARDGQPLQIIDERCELHLPFYDLSHEEQEQREVTAKQIAAREAARAFDLERGPVWRASLLRMSADDHVLLLCLHHIASDGWSTGVLVREFTALYEAMRSGTQSGLAELDVQYADFAAWQKQWLRGEALEQHLSYWRDQLAGVPVLELLTDRPRPSIPTYRGARAGFSLSPELTHQLKQMSRTEGVTLFMTLLAAYQVVLGRYSGQHDVVVGTDVANRNQLQTESLIGFFVNQLVLRTDLSGNPRFRELLRQVRERTLSAYEHQDVPFEKLVEELSPQRNLARSPLFQVKLVLQNAPRGELRAAGVSFSGFSESHSVSKLDITLIVGESEAGVVGVAEYATDLYEASSIQRMVEHLRVVLESIAADSEQRIAEVALLTAAERQQVVEEWNSTKREYSRYQSVQEMFQRQAEQRPDAVAVVYEQEQMSYGELNERANRLAHYLMSMGVGPEVKVALCVERSLEMIVGLMGVLKAGGAYVPMDPSYPADRLAFMMEDAQAPLLITTSDLSAKLPGAWVQAIEMDTQWEMIGSQPASDPAAEAGPANLAYQIYTSGSTGRPKGVMITHRGLTNYLLWAGEAYRVDECSGSVVHSSISFDLTITGLMVPLVCGSRVTLVGGEDAIGALARAVEVADSCSLIKLTPSQMEVARSEQGGKESGRFGKVLVIGGEALRWEEVRQWKRQAGEGRLINEYGPTETVVGCCVYEASGEEEEEGGVPIGRPIENARAYVMDRGGEVSGIGVVGELVIGGAGVGRGYWQRAELTAERFVPDGISGEEGARLYRTGDRARWRADGELEFLGRMDEQVKVRGYRIELGEVESVLSQHAGVKQCAVIVREDEPGDRRLVAYVVAAGERELSSSEMREHLRIKLPDYMVPSAYVMMAELPLTANGKLDRKALPEPGSEQRQAEGQWPRTAVEEIVAGIWEEVLRRQGVGIADNFFELGGHSLLATQVVSRVREVLGVEVALRVLFETPTVAGMAKAVEREREEERREEAPPILSVSRDRELALSFAQQRLWFIHQMEPGSTAYNIPMAVRLGGKLNITALRQGLQEIARRHEVLRTRFEARDGQPAQVIDERCELHLPFYDLSHEEQEQREVTAKQIAAREAARAFDLERGPVWRAALLRMSNEDHILFVCIHHIASDGWSTGIIVKEFATLYEAMRAGNPSRLAELDVQYADFAMWQRQWLRGEALEQHLSYWREQLAGVPVLELPTDKPRTSVAYHKGARVGFSLSADLTQQLKQVSRTEGVTLFMTLLAAYQVVLGRYSGQHDVVVGTDVANRNQLQTESLIGFFVNQLVLRADLSGNPHFRELLRQVRERTLSAYEHQDVPFEKVVEELQPERRLNHTPIFTTLFVWENMPPQTIESMNLVGSPFPLDTPTPKFEWVVFMHETAGEIACSWLYRADLFHESTIERLCLRFQSLLEKVAASPNARLRELETTIEASGKSTERFARPRLFDKVRPRTVALPLGDLVTTSHFSSDQSLPMIVTPAVDDFDPNEWARTERDFIERNLLKHGAILFRGFKVEGPGEFEGFASAICPELFSEYGDLPREQVDGKVYGSTPYPNDRAILFHNESSHMHFWPLKIWFYCLTPPQQGGETPVVDCRVLYSEMDPALRQEFFDRGLMYVRNFGDGLDVSWQDFFKTSNREAVEEFCRKAGIACEWRAGNTLRTMKHCAAVATHPRTGQQVFFNQLQAHHVSCLDAGVRQALLNLFGEEGLPRNVYYGDGEAIPDSVVDEVRRLYDTHAASFIWERGDVLMVDNMLVAHSRRPFVGPRKIVVAMGEMINSQVAV